ncbi:DUF3011 domain-containing protein [Pseudoxanthomonas sp. UTMC 1351]|uniref:DUF3011 domain-containing protein n=1 Tax=Pseudoxanthomonas sp. UTMC 1351 TaxID=2695853 RepID=UPI0034CE1A2E
MRVLIALCSLVVGLASNGQVIAAPQNYDSYYGGGGQAFRCESRDNRYRHCAVDVRGGVELVRGLSKTHCVEGRNWGYDRNGVWVSHGCRAEFRTGGGGGWNGGGGGAQIVRCDSNDGRHRTCAIPRGGHVRLVRQVSKTRCVEGHNWGRERGAIWVNRGCRAEFEVSRRGGGWGGGGWGGGWNGDHGNGHGQVFRCDSNDRRTRYCEVNARRVSLVRQVSRTPCIEGRTWGQDRRGVWVTEGCRAEFRAW